MADTNPRFLTFLFWNIGHRDMRQVLSRVVAMVSPDVLILAEAKEFEAPIFFALNASSPAFYLTRDSNCEKVTIFTAFPSEFIRTVRDTHRYTLRSISLPGSDELLLAAAHLPSRLHFSTESISEACVEMARDVRDFEMEMGHDRTILVGDLNLNPFENGVTKATGLHATMSRSIASRGGRTVQGREYPFFYNPMWGHFGDLEGSSSGTFYYDRAEHVNLFWNMFDQVLIRPSLLDRFSSVNVRVIKSDGRRSLLTRNGIPDKNYASDHLPIVFKVRI